MNAFFDHIRQSINSGNMTHTPLADGTGVLLNIGQGQVMSLNSTGQQLVQLILGGADTNEELAKALTEQHKIEYAVALNDVNEFIDQLSQAITLPK